MKTIILILICLNTLITIAQSSFRNEFFPTEKGNMWEYYFTDYAGDDTAQVFTIDSYEDEDGNINLKQVSRFINPIRPAVMFDDTMNFRVDTAGNVWGPTGGFKDILVYKNNIDTGDKWILFNGYNIKYEMARVVEKETRDVFGVDTDVFTIVYYSTRDTSEYLGLVRYGHIIAKNIGVIYKGGGDAIGNVFLTGCVIDGILYGDTTNVVTAIEILPNTNLLTNHKLYQNYPNPFNNQTKIPFYLAKPSNVSIVIYDITGRQVLKVLNKNYYNSGEYEVQIDLKASSGVYLYQLITDEKSLSRQMLYVK